MDILEENSNVNANGITSEQKSLLTLAGKWGKFIGIVGIIFGALIGLAGLFMLFGATQTYRDEEMVTFILMGLLYIFMSVIGIIACIALTSFGSHAKSGAQSGGSALTKSFAGLSKFFKIMGIATIVYLCILALSLVLLLIALVVSL